MAKKKIVKISFGEGGLKGALLRQVEKIVFAGALLASLAIIWFGWGRKPIEETYSPENLQQAATSARTNVINDTWATQELELFPAIDRYEERVGRALAVVDEKNYPAPILLKKPLFPLKLKRSDPTLFPVEKLEVKPGFGGIAMQTNEGGPNRGNRFFDDEDQIATADGYTLTPKQEERFSKGAPGAGTKVEGKYFVSILGLVPIARQRDEYRNSFESSVGPKKPERDRPKYDKYEIWRVEVSDDGSDPNWDNKVVITSEEIAEGSREWNSDEIVDLRYVNMSNLTSEKNVKFASGVPQIWMRDMAQYSRHSEVPFQAAKPQPGQEDHQRDQSEVAQEVDYRMFRAFDFAVEPGKSYQYKIVLSLHDPNHPELASAEPPEHHLDASVANRLAEVRKSESPGQRHFLRDTPPSDPSEIVSVSAPSRVLAGVTSENRALHEMRSSMMAIVWDNDKAMDVPGQVDVYAGSLVDFSKEAIVYVAGIRGLGKLPNYSYQTGTTVLDIRGGKPSRGPRDPIIAPDEVLLLDSNGNLIVQTQIADYEDYTLNTFVKKRREAADGGQKRPPNQRGRGGRPNPGKPNPGKPNPGNR